jgi:signal transduction histidine kinase
MVLRAKPSILVIDDDEVARDSAKMLLSRWGYNVRLADRGEAGVEALSVQPPDLVLVDLQMPGISGLEVLQAVQEFDPAIVCIMVTGFATLQSAVDAMKHGAYDFLAKPFSPDELKLAVKRGLERRFLELETQKLRQEKARMEANFVTMVSHQMRSPLTAARQLLEAAVTGALGPLSEAHQKILDRAAARLDDLLQDINAWLAMSAIAKEGISERLETVPLGEIMQHLIQRAELECEAAGQTLETDLAPEPASLRVDRGSLMEALYNLASNAVKYNRPGGVVKLSTRVKAHHVDIAVADQGPGIPQKDLPYIFDDFFRSKSPELKSKTGTGLGLSIAKRVVQAHGGEIEVESREGHGSVFTVSLAI